MRGLKFIALMSLAVLLMGCSKTVQWEEEVPLNTGETIWVQRKDTFDRVGGADNPLKTAWALKLRELKFNRQGQEYSFQTQVYATMMIHEFDSPKAIAIVAWATDCAKRGYGEFRWVNSSWQLQKNVSPTLIGKPRNLMDFYSGVDGEIPPKVTQEFIVNSHFEDSRRGGTESHLLDSRIATNCSRSK